MMPTVPKTKVAMTPKRKRTLLWVGSILVGIILEIAVGIVPGVQRVLEERKKISQVQELNRSLTAKVNVLENSDVNSLDNRLNIATASVPLVSPYQQSLSLLFSLLNKYTLEVSELRFTTVHDKERLLIGVNLTTAGQYTSIEALLKDLNNSIPLVSVNSVKLSRKIQTSAEKEQGSTPAYVADISLQVQQDPPPKTIGKPSDPLPPISADLEKTLTALQGFSSFHVQTSTSMEPVVPASALFKP